MVNIKGFTKYIKVDERSAQDLFHEFEISLSRAFIQGNEKNVEALQMLGNALTRRGLHREALEVDRRIARLAPKDPTAFYNLACSYSNLEDFDRAIEALEKAFALGYRDYKHLLRDPDLRGLRKDPRFKKLLNKRWGKRQP